MASFPRLGSAWPAIQEGLAVLLGLKDKGSGREAGRPPTCEHGKGRAAGELVYLI